MMCQTAAVLQVHACQGDGSHCSVQPSVAGCRRSDLIAPPPLATPADAGLDDRTGTEVVIKVCNRKRDAAEELKALMCRSGTAVQRVFARLLFMAEHQKCVAAVYEAKHGTLVHLMERQVAAACTQACMHRPPPLSMWRNPVVLPAQAVGPTALLRHASTSLGLQPPVCCS